MSLAAYQDDPELFCRSTLIKLIARDLGHDASIKANKCRSNKTCTYLLTRSLIRDREKPEDSKSLEFLATS